MNSIPIPKLQDYIDLRSDVVSIAPPEMLQAMSIAQVGDDVFQDDPTANKFQQTIAKYFGFQASMIVPSTTMANLISVLLLTKPGDQIIIWGNSHTIQRQCASIALIGGIQTRQILTQTGIFTLDQIKKRVRKQSQHVTYPNTSLIMVQNPTYTGQVWPLGALNQLATYARKQGIKLLLDGARILHAVSHYKCNSNQISKYCDVMTMCLSKSLCCPFGSLVFGSAQDIKKARQIRKSLGGGMRQIGIIGAAGLYALEHMVSQVQKDNEIAKYLGSKLSQIPGVQVDGSKIEANMVNFKIKIQNFNHSGYHAYLLQSMIKIKPLNQDRQQYRLVTHRTIRQKQCNQFLQLTKKFISQHSKNPIIEVWQEKKKQISTTQLKEQNKPTEQNQTRTQ